MTLFELPATPKQSKRGLRHPTGAEWHDDESLTCGTCDQKSTRWTEDRGWIAVCGRIEPPCLACSVVEWMEYEAWAEEASRIMASGEALWDCPGHDTTCPEPDLPHWRLIRSRRACEHWKDREAENVLRSLSGVKPWEDPS